MQSGRRRLINQLATGFTHSAYFMPYSDPTLAVRDFTEQMEHFAKQLADYQQEKRIHHRQRMKNTLQEQFQRNVQHLAHIAGGTFAIAGVLKQELPTIGEMPDLMLHIAPDLEEIARYKGGVPQMLYDKWCREYKILPPRRLLQFSQIA